MMAKCRIAIMAVAVCAMAARADINLEFRVISAVVTIDDEVRVGLYMVSDDPFASQYASAAQVIFEWNPMVLRLDAVSPLDAESLIFNGFPINGSSGLNESILPQDGDAIFIALAPLGNAIEATPAGVLIATFVFKAIAVSDETVVVIVPTGGSPELRTIVFDGVLPNTDVTCGLGEVEIVVLQRDCGPVDLNEDGFVDFFDVAIFLTLYDFAMGDPIPPPAGADFIPDGVLDFFDVGEFLRLFDLGCVPE